MKLKDFKQTLKTSAKFHIDDSRDRIPVSDYIAKPIPKRPVFIWDRVVSTMVTLVFVFLLSLYVYTSIQPVTVLTIDFNPSLELELNRFDRVLDIRSDDAGGQDILSNINYNNQKIDKVMDLIYDYSVAQGYLDPEEAYVLIGVYGEDESKELSLTDKLADLANYQTLFIIQHSLRSYELGSPNYLSNTESSTSSEEYYGVIDSSDSPAVIGDLFPSAEDADNAEAPRLTEAEMISVANTLAISPTKLALVLDIFYLSEDYGTENDLYILAMMEIGDLIVLYESLA